MFSDFFDCGGENFLMKGCLERLTRKLLDPLSVHSPIVSIEDLIEFRPTGFIKEKVVNDFGNEPNEPKWTQDGRK